MFISYGLKGIYLYRFFLFTQNMAKPNFKYRGYVWNVQKARKVADFFMLWGCTHYATFDTRTNFW